MTCEARRNAAGFGDRGRSHNSKNTRGTPQETGKFRDRISF